MCSHKGRGGIVTVKILAESWSLLGFWTDATTGTVINLEFSDEDGGADAERRIFWRERVLRRLALGGSTGGNKRDRSIGCWGNPGDIGVERGVGGSKTTVSNRVLVMTRVWLVFEPEFADGQVISTARDIPLPSCNNPSFCSQQ